MRPTRILLLLALGGPALSAQDRSPAAEDVAVFREPRHHLVFQGRFVRVLDVRVPPGDTTLYHVHADPHVGVMIATARTWGQARGAPASAVDSLADSIGTILDNANEQLPYSHRVGNADTVAFRYVVGQLLAPSGIAAPILPPSSGVRLERETPRARVYRVTLAPGESTRAHRHLQPGLTVQVGAGSLRLEGTTPEAKSPSDGAGAWWWRRAGTQHALRNVGAAPVEVVEIDWR